MREQVEDVFLEWKEGLERSIQDLVDYEEYDGGLQMVFVYRRGIIDAGLLGGLEALLQEKVSPHLLVSSLVVGNGLDRVR